MTSFGAPPPDGTWKFNPPPGWPAPQNAWVPPPNWQPDPSWPAAPADWPFWIPVGYIPASAPASTPAPTPASTPRKKKIRLATVGGAIAGAISLVATMVATWIALADRPEPYTIDQWRQTANATCERDFGDVQLSLNAGLLTLGQFAADPPPPGQINDDMTDAAKSLGEIAAGFRRLSADLREIQVPEGFDRTDIDALLSATGDVAATVGGMGTFLVNYQLGQTSVDQMQQLLVSMQTLNTTTMPRWSAAAVRLQLDQCQTIMGTAPVSTAASTTPAPAALNAAQSALAARLDPAVLINCAPGSSGDIAGVSAAVNCIAARPGPTQLPLVMQFTDAPAMLAWVGRVAAGLGAGTCGAGNSTSPWHHNDVTVGTLVCQSGSNGLYRIVWTFDDANIVVVAEAPNGAALYTWWESNAYLVPA